jgi:hypothetical protein
MRRRHQLNGGLAPDLQRGRRRAHSHGMTQSLGQPAATPRRLVCARCGTSFDCGLAGDCWCAAEPFKLPLPAAQADNCLCPACLRKAATAAAE